MRVDVHLTHASNGIKFDRTIHYFVDVFCLDLQHHIIFNVVSCPILSEQRLC